MGLLKMLGTLELNAAPFHAAMKAAEISSEKFGHTLKHHLAGAIGPAALLYGSERILHATIEYAESIAILSERLDTSTDSAQEWNLAAKLSGQETETVASAFQNMEKALISASNGTEKSKRDLKALGIGMEEIKTIGVDEAMRRAADETANLGTKSEQAEARLDIFGRKASKVKVILEDLHKASAVGKLGGFADENALENVRQYADVLQAGKTAMIGAWTRMGSPGSLIATMGGMLPGTPMNRFAGGKINALWHRMFGKKKEEGTISRGGETEEDITDREMETQHRITEAINKTNEAKKKTYELTTSELVQLDDAIAKYDRLRKMYGPRQPEAQAVQDQAIAEAEQDVARLNKSVMGRLSPMSDSMSAIGNFIGGNLNVNGIDKLDIIHRDLMDIKQAVTQNSGESLFSL